MWSARWQLWDLSGSRSARVHPRTGLLCGCSFHLLVAFEIWKNYETGYYSRYQPTIAKGLSEDKFTHLPKDLRLPNPSANMYNVGRRWGCVFRVEVNEVDLWLGWSRDTYDTSTEDSASGPRLCSCAGGLGLVSFSPTIRVFHQEIIFHLVKNKFSLVNNRLVTN